MTRKDYIKLVQAIRESRIPKDESEGPDPVYMDLGVFLVRLCNVLKADNKAFDEDKFYASVYAKDKV